MRALIIIGALSLSLGGWACDKKADGPPAADQGEQVVVEVTPAEKATFEKEAAAQITADNAEAEAAKLLKEIEADLE